MKLITAPEVHTALIDTEVQVLNAIQSAYIAHDLGQSDLPFSAFVRPTAHPGTRFITLPAYLGGDMQLAGVKWVSSFPDNVSRGQQRASSLVILSGLDDGYPRAIVEGSRINAWRTAASAGLASATLRSGRPVTTIGVIGCGTIAREQVRFLRVVHPEARVALVYDADLRRAQRFAEVIEQDFPQLVALAVADHTRLLAESDTLVLATTAATPWLELPAGGCRPGQVVLHVSLRDITPESILRSHNVVDDLEHVNREGTSIALAAERAPDTSFVSGTLGAVLRSGDDRTYPGGVVFSPFGLGILDLAVAQLVLERAAHLGLGTDIDGFDPPDHAVTESVTNSTGAQS